MQKWLIVTILVVLSAGLGIWRLLISKQSRRSKAIGSMGFIVTSIIILITLYSGPTKENQQKMLNQSEKTTSLLEQMQRIDKTDYKKLIQKYPLGYVLFAIDHKEVITPYKSRLTELCEIDWSTAKVAALTEKTIALEFPTISFKKGKFTDIGSNVIINYRKVGILRGGYLIHGYNMDFEVVAELLVDSSEGLICLIGLKELNGLRIRSQN